MTEPDMRHGQMECFVFGPVGDASGMPKLARRGFIMPSMGGAQRPDARDGSRINWSKAPLGPGAMRARTLAIKRGTIPPLTHA